MTFSFNETKNIIEDAPDGVVISIKFEYQRAWERVTVFRMCP